jgi:hypothetical protein
MENKYLKDNHVRNYVERNLNLSQMNQVHTLRRYLRSFRSHCGLDVDSATNRNEYQESFLGIKTAGA